MKFRCRSVQVNAVRLSRDIEIAIDADDLLVARKGEWLVRDEDGELHTCTHREFCRRYEPAGNFAAAYLSRNRGPDVSPV